MNVNTFKGRRKVLVPLATMLVAGAVAVGSGATFTSTSVHTASVTSGVVHHTNNHNGASLVVTNLKPGDTQSGSLTIKNDGTLQAGLTLQATAKTDAFVAGAVSLKIMHGATTVYNGDFAGLNLATKYNLGDLAVNESTTLDYTVSMDPAASDANQAKSASAGFQYVTTQSGSGESALSWLP